MEDTKEKTLFKYIARESMTELLQVANAREIKPEDFIQIVVKGNTFNLVYIERYA